MTNAEICVKFYLTYAPYVPTLVGAGLGLAGHKRPNASTATNPDIYISSDSGSDASPAKVPRIGGGAGAYG